MCFILGAAIIAGAGLAGSALSSSAQAGGAKNALGIQSQMFNRIQGQEAPFLSAGYGATKELNYLLGTGPKSGVSGVSGTYGSLTAPFTTKTFQTMSPAYQFTKQQGDQGVLNQEGTSGSALAPPALKDLIAFNSQNANLAFNNAFNQYQTQNSNIFNRLYDVAGLGMQAGGASTTGAPTFATAMGNSAYNIGSAQAGGFVGGANSISNAMPWLYAGQTPAVAGSYYPNSVNNYGDMSSLVNPGTTISGAGNA